MREITFRAWDKKRKLMAYKVEEIHDGVLPNIEENKDVLDKFIRYESFKGLKEDEDIILMQYTGLDDMDGKEIYVGDVIETYRYFPPTGDEDYQIGVVKVGMGGFYIDLGEDCTNNFEIPYEGGDDHQVLGNMYENPELLKKLKYSQKSDEE